MCEKVVMESHWRGFLGEFSVQSVRETLDECVSSSHNHAAIQTLSQEEKESVVLEILEQN